jgi:2,3-dihydroxybenzoate decarboxylase
MANVTSASSSNARPGGAVGYLRIATEEAFAPPEIVRLYVDMLEKGALDDPGFKGLSGFYLSSKSERARFVANRLQDLGPQRIRDMDASGIDKQIISLTAPGVQVFDRATAVSMATLANDQLSEAVARHPSRYIGLGAIAPQDPPAAAKEMERSVKKLGFKGAVINSHTHGEYLDDPKFWAIFEAAQALDVPIYLHPTGPSRGLIGPMLDYGLDGAIYGFGVETGLHLLRIIVSGVFDRFPSLKIVVGHLGEALPFWLFRLDYMHAANVESKRHERMKPLRKKVSDYMRENVYVTTSGMAWEPAIMFCRQVLGADRVLYAMDYPYQYEVSEVVTSDNLPLSLEEKKRFFQTNAERVFRL